MLSGQTLAVNTQRSAANSPIIGRLNATGAASVIVIAIENEVDIAGVPQSITALPRRPPEHIHVSAAE